jgi:uncharacterized membrane protein YhaH (DUF805 family)
VSAGDVRSSVEGTSTRCLARRQGAEITAQCAQRGDHVSGDQPVQPSQPVVGWYPDPADATQIRYWDGSSWTTHVLPATPAAPAAPAWQSAPAPAPAPVVGSYAPTPAYGAPAYGYPVYGAPLVQPRKVGFGEAIKRAFAGWKDYSSRATVGEYWWFYLFQMLVFMVPYIALIVLFAAAFPSPTYRNGVRQPAADPSPGALTAVVILGILLLVLAVVLFVVGLPLAIRRLHDTDREGLWYLLVFVPFGSIVLIVFMVQAGTPGPNRYGPVPT